MPVGIQLAGALQFMHLPILKYGLSLLNESLTNEETGERRETFNRFCRQRFDIDKVDGVDGLTLGELVNLFYKLNDIMKQDLNLQNKLYEEFQRKSVIPSKLFLTLEGSLKACKYLAHDKGQTSKSNNVIVKEFAQKLKQAGFYPHAIRVKREVTDEFGRCYVEAVDEDGKSWLIHSLPTITFNPEIQLIRHVITVIH